MGLWWQGGPRGPGDMVCRLRVWEELSFSGVDPRANVEWGEPLLFYQKRSYCGINAVYCTPQPSGCMLSMLD